MAHQLSAMGHQYVELYDRIQAFSFDQPNASLPFSRKVAKENAWSSEYAARVIEEYRKFVFLAVVAGHTVSPSDQVDQVWHLHLSYTRSYWQEFCPNVLQIPLHHEPSGGGSDEAVKFEDLYRQTIASYTQFFGEVPPIDIWPKPKERLGRFERINTQKNWVLPKPRLSIAATPRLRQVVGLSSLLVLALVVTSCQMVGESVNPLDFTGPEFLSFYITISVIGIALASWLRFSLRLPDKMSNQQPDLNPL